MTENMSRSRPGLGFRLEFGEPVSGPVLLGSLSHFGYSIFIPEETSRRVPAGFAFSGFPVGALRAGLVRTSRRGPGSPGSSTMFYVTYYYQQAFTDLHLGYASAMAFLLFILVLIITVVLLKTSRRWVYYENDQR